MQLHSLLRVVTASAFLATPCCAAAGRGHDDGGNLVDDFYTETDDVVRGRSAGGYPIHRNNNGADHRRNFDGGIFPPCLEPQDILRRSQDDGAGADGDNHMTVPAASMVQPHDSPRNTDVVHGEVDQFRESDVFGPHCSNNEEPRTGSHDRGSSLLARDDPVHDSSLLARDFYREPDDVVRGRCPLRTRTSSPPLPPHPVLRQAKAERAYKKFLERTGQDPSTAMPVMQTSLGLAWAEAEDEDEGGSDEDHDPTGTDHADTDQQQLPERPPSSDSYSCSCADGEFFIGISGTS